VPVSESSIEPEALAFAGEGKQLLIARRSGWVLTLDSDTQAKVGSDRSVALTREWMTPAEPAAFDPGGHWLAGISEDDPRVARCWDARTRAERATLRGHTLDLLLVTVNGSGQVVTAGRSAPGEPLRSSFLRHQANPPSGKTKRAGRPAAPKSSGVTARGVKLCREALSVGGRGKRW
jgi:hypothetical protein